MAQFQNDELEYVVDDYFDMADFDLEDDPFQEGHQLQRTNSDSDLENDDADENKQKNDTSALEARNGKDIQGIPWERLNFTRDKYREMRLKQYKNYENFPRSRSHFEKECKQVEKGSTFYDFQFNTRLVKSTIVHFQGTAGPGLTDPFVLTTAEGWYMNLYNLRYLRLVYISHVRMPDLFSHVKLRNLLWATSKHDVYLMQNYSLMHWSSLLRRGKEVFNVAGQVVPTLKTRGSLAQPVSRVQISTIVAKDNLMVAGGFQGELVCKYLNRPGVTFCTKITNEVNAITNSVDIYQSSNGSTRLMTANNDSNVRVFDTENFNMLSCLSFPWSVNNTSVSPDGKLLAVLGDSVDCLIADSQSGTTVGSLKGHSDYSFSSAWHPNGQILATGNQDTTCRLWDVRKLSESFAVLKGRMGAIRALKFTSDGRFMAMAEPADFVHIYDTQSGYCKEQEIDLFGEIAGISFSPDTEALFIGVADRTYGSMLEFNKKRSNQYLYSFM